MKEVLLSFSVGFLLLAILAIMAIIKQQWLQVGVFAGLAGVGAIILFLSANIQVWIEDGIKMLRFEFEWHLTLLEKYDKVMYSNTSGRKLKPTVEVWDDSAAPNNSEPQHRQLSMIGRAIAHITVPKTL